MCRVAPAARLPSRDASSRSRTMATPSSSLLAVTSSTAASTSGSALATAMPRPAHASMVRSLGMSPMATTSAGATPSRAQTRSSANALVTPAAETSTTWRVVEVRVAREHLQQRHVDELQGVAVPGSLGRQRVTAPGGLATEPVGVLPGEGDPGGRLAEAADDPQRHLGRQRRLVLHGIAVEVVDQGTVGADRDPLQTEPLVE